MSPTISSLEALTPEQAAAKISAANETWDNAVSTAKTPEDLSVARQTRLDDLKEALRCRKITITGDAIETHAFGSEKKPSAHLVAKEVCVIEVNLLQTEEVPSTIIAAGIHDADNGVGELFVVALDSVEWELTSRLPRTDQ